MLKPWPLILLAGLAVLLPSGGQLMAGGNDVATVDSAVSVLQELTDSNFKCIPPALLQDAQGVAVIPNVIKAGFVVGGRHGRGVVLIRQPDGS